MSEDKPDLGRGVPSSALPEGAMLAGCFEGEAVLLVKQGGLLGVFGVVFAWSVNRVIDFWHSRNSR